MSSNPAHPLQRFTSPHPSLRFVAPKGGLTSLTLAFAAASCASTGAGASRSADPVLVRNLDALLSEDPERAAALERSVRAFLTQAITGEFTDDVVNVEELDRHRMFYDRVGGFGDSPGMGTPSILKAYTLNGVDYFVTLAFAGQQDGTPFLDMIVEMKATPHGDGYRFHCPFEERTKDFHETTLGDVRFRYSGPFDEERARQFLAVRSKVARLAGIETGPLEYYAFQSLDEMLKCYGLIFDEARCNFLGHDLGMFDDGGRRYVTGMGDESYLYGYLSIFLASPHHDRSEMYGTMSVGFRTLFGGYWLSGTPMEELRDELRQTVARDSGLDLVDIFKKGRNGQTIGHAPSLVMAALICEHALEVSDFDGLLRLIYSGSSGERFFSELEAVLGIDEAGFRDAIALMLDVEATA